jgi:cation diffusion facilitator family transporter
MKRVPASSVKTATGQLGQINWGVYLVSDRSQKNNLTRYAWLSIGAAILTIGLKLGAYYLTNSVGLLSDALESLVNLVTAIVALIALNIAVKPADEEFAYGYSKVEFFSSGFEGGMILLAAVSIAFTAIPRLINPQPIEQVGLGLAISIIASIINFVVARVLLQAGRRHGSITLEADARHLMTDVYTTIGVIVGVVLVSLTGWLRLDPIIALLVAANILYTGFVLLRRSARGLMDVSLPEAEVSQVQNILQDYESYGVKFHALRTRSAAARGFVSMHILVPGSWSVWRAHQLAEQIEQDIHQRLPSTAVFTHVEPLDDPTSLEDSSLERE